MWPSQLFVGIFRMYKISLPPLSPAPPSSSVDPSLFDLPIICSSLYKECKGLRHLLIKEEVGRRPSWGIQPRLPKGELKKEFGQC